MHRQRDELDLRIRTPHAVTVDHRYADPRGDEERDHGVDATDLHRHDGLNPPVQEAVYRLVRLHHLFAERKLLDERHRRANHEWVDDHRLVIQLVGGDQLHRAVPRQRLQRDQRSQVRIASSAGAKYS